MIKKIKNTSLTILIGIIMYFYCLLVFYIVPFYNKNTQDETLQKNTDEIIMSNTIEQTEDINNIIIDTTIENINNNLEYPQEAIQISEEEKNQKNNIQSKSQASIQTDTNEWTKATVTAYCPCEKCCGKSNGITASGTTATAGRTIAMSKQYPFNTKIEIKDYGTFIVEDRGGAIQGNKIDMFFNTHQEALNFGKKQLYFRIVK